MHSEHTLTSGGLPICYDAWAPTGAPTATVVISHGLGEHKQRYDHVASRFTEHGYAVVVADHRGHGRSGGKRLQFDGMSQFVEDLHAVVAAAVPDRSVPLFLLGHSFGGAVALEYALAHQAELAGLILSGPAVVPGEGLPTYAIALAKVLGRVAPNLKTAQLESAAVSRDPAVVAAYDNDPLVYHGKVPAGMGGGLLRAMDSYPGRLPALRLPMLVLHGEQDRLTKPDGSRMVAERTGSSDVTLKIYDGLYHEIFNEPEQDTVLRDVTDWIDKHR